LKQFERANVWYLAMNQKAFAPFKDKKVRQAFAYAINKDELIRVALKNTVTKANGILPPGVPGYDANYQGLAYNPAKAKQLLAEAGFPDGKNFPPLTITFRQGYKEIADGALAIRNDLKTNLGITVEVKELEWAQFLKDRTAGIMPCSHLRWGADYLDAQNFLSLLLYSSSRKTRTVIIILRLTNCVTRQTSKPTLPNVSNSTSRRSVWLWMMRPGSFSITNVMSNCINLMSKDFAMVFWDTSHISQQP